MAPSTYQNSHTKHALDPPQPESSSNLKENLISRSTPKIKTFPIQQTPLEIQWHSNSQYASLPSEEKQKSIKYLNKLYQYNITTLHQIQNNVETSIISKEEFKQKYKALPKIIKAIQQAQISLLTQHRIDTTLQNQNQNHTNTPHPITNNTNGSLIHSITNERIRKEKINGEPKPYTNNFYANGTHLTDL